MKQAASSAVSLLSSIFIPEDGDDMFLRNIGRLFTRLHGMISQKIQLFKTTAVITSDSTEIVQLYM
jgi:hypothetical protein